METLSTSLEDIVLQRASDAELWCWWDRNMSYAWDIQSGSRNFNNERVNFTIYFSAVFFTQMKESKPKAVANEYFIQS